jgi:hypothetical protein
MRAGVLLCLAVTACFVGGEPAPTELTPGGGTDPSSSTATPTTLASTGSPEPDNDFVVPADGGLADECDPYAQTCPPGHKCAWTGAWHSPERTRCVPLAPEPLPDGAECAYNLEALDGIDECGRWAVCVESGPGGQDGVGTCVAMCRGSGEHPYCEDDGVCLGGRTLWLCAPLCDPFAQDCPEQSRCDLVGAAPICLYDPPDAPEQPTGGACSDPRDCAPGSTCMPGATPTCEFACCTPFCDRDDPEAGCPVPGQQCLPPLDDHLQPGAESVGVCRMETP